MKKRLEAIFDLKQEGGKQKFALIGAASIENAASEQEPALVGSETLVWTVPESDEIGLVGRTGNATGNQCHVELVKDGNYLDLHDYFDK